MYQSTAKAAASVVFLLVQIQRRPGYTWNCKWCETEWLVTLHNQIYKSVKYSIPGV